MSLTEHNIKIEFVNIKCQKQKLDVLFSIFHLELLRKKQRAIIENNPQQLAVACKHLADCYHENHQYENALACYKEEANAYELLGKRLDKAKAHRMIGEMYMLLEKFDEALKHELVYLSTSFRRYSTIAFSSCNRNKTINRGLF